MDYFSSPSFVTVPIIFIVLINLLVNKETKLYSVIFPLLFSIHLDRSVFIDALGININLSSLELNHNRFQSIIRTMRMDWIPIQSNWLASFCLFVDHLLCFYRHKMRDREWKSWFWEKNRTIKNNRSNMWKGEKKKEI